MLALCYFCSTTDFFLAPAGEKERTFRKKHWFEVNFSDRLTFYGRNSPTPLFRDKSETDWDRPGMTKWKTTTSEQLRSEKVVEMGKEIEINLSFNEHAFKSNVFRRSRCVWPRGRMGFLHCAFLNLAALFTHSPSSSPSNYFVSHNVPTAISDTNKSFQWYYERSGFIPPFLHSSRHSMRS